MLKESVWDVSAFWDCLWSAFVKESLRGQDLQNAYTGRGNSVAEPRPTFHCHVQLVSFPLYIENCTSSGSFPFRINLPSCLWNRRHKMVTDALLVRWSLSTFARHGWILSARHYLCCEMKFIYTQAEFKVFMLSII